MEKNKVVQNETMEDISKVNVYGAILVFFEGIEFVGVGFDFSIKLNLLG